MVRPLLILAALAGAAAAPAQEPTDTSPAPQGPIAQRVKRDAQAVRDILRKSLAAKISPKTAADPIYGHSYHVVFLFQSSQVSAKSAYATYARQFVGSFLDTLVEAQTKRGFLPEERYRVSAFPYQTGLYTPPKWSSVITANLPLDADVAKSTAARLPALEIGQSPDGTPYFRKGANGERVGAGTDHVGSRSALLKFLEEKATEQDPKRTRPVLVIQIASNELNESPLDRERDSRIRGQRSAQGGLESTGYELYGEHIGETEPGGRNMAPFPVRLWIYGPSVVAPGVTKVATRALTRVPAPRSAASGPLIVAAVVGLLALLGFAFFFASGRRRVRVGDVSRSLAPGGMLYLSGPNSSRSGATAILLPPHLARDAADDDVARLENRFVKGLVLVGNVYEVAGGDRPLRPGSNQVSLSRLGRSAINLDIVVT